MAISTYSDLQAACIALDGSNNLTTFIDTAIATCEAEMYANSTEILNHRGDETQETLTILTSSRYIAIPVDILEIRRVRLFYDDDRDFNMTYVTPEAMIVKQGTGTPAYYTVTNLLEFDILPDVNYDIEVQGLFQPTALSDDNDTNTVLTSFPNIYLFGTLWSVNQFNAEEEKAEYYYGKFINAIKGANAKTNMLKYGPAPRVMNRSVVN